MKTLNPNLTARKDALTSTPCVVAVFHFPGGDVFVADRDITVPSGPTFKGLVTSWGSLTSRSTGLFSVPLPEITLELSNTSATPFSTYLDSGGLSDAAEVELYLWFSGLAWSDKEPIGRFMISSPVTYSDDSVRLTLVSALIKRNVLTGRTITRDDYPYADPDAIGKTENIIYGAPKNVLCHPIIAGASSTLVTDITASQTTGIELSMTATETAFPTSGTLQIGAEKISYTGISSRTLTGVTRGASSTTPVSHKKGAPAFEVRTDFTYLVAGHPVKTIGDVYIGGVRVASGITKQTDSGGKARVVLSSRFTVEKSVALSIADSGHRHGITDQTVSLFGSIGEIGYGKAALISSVPSGTATRGPISSITVKITLVDTDVYNMHFAMTDYSSYWNLSTGTLELIAGDMMTFTVSASSISYADMNWASNLKVSIDDTDGRAATIHSVEFIVGYTADSTDAVTGVTLSGNSAADVVIGGAVTADVEGYADDTSGSFTGASGALISNPADVIKHFLVAHMNVPTTEIGPSFTSARTALAALVYSFSGVINSPTDALDAIESWSAQSRLKLSYDGYTAALRLITNGAPTADKTIPKSSIKKSSLKLTRTTREELINRLEVQYLRDWSKKSATLAVMDRSATFPANGDSTSVSAFGPRQPNLPYRFDFVSGGAHASLLRDFYITRFKDIKRRVFITTFLDCFGLQEGDIIALDYSSPAFSLTGAVFFIEKLSLLPGSFTKTRPDELIIQAREV